MSERYTRVYTQKENLYASGAPVIIKAGALLKDNQTGDILAQLKFKNILIKRIKALKIQLYPYDTMGNLLDETVAYQYLDLSAGLNSEFGSKEPVLVPNPVTRAFSVKVVSVAFADNTIWTAGTEPWEPLPAQIKFKDKNHPEFVKQYHLTYGENANYLLLEEKDLWFCVCGAANEKDNEKCIVCGKSLEKLRQFDMDALKRACVMRLKAEQIQKEKEEQEQQEKRAESRKKRIKLIKIAFVVAGLICVCAIPAKIVYKIHEKYSNAVALMEAGKYLDAITVFEKMNGYKDSEIQIENCKSCLYDEAISIIDEKMYTKAIAKFKYLDGYKDSEAQIENCKAFLYDEAISVMKEKMYTEAIKKFKYLDGYNDSEVQIENCKASIKQMTLLNKNQISAGFEHIVGLRSDGTVVAVDNNDYGQCNTSNWSNIIAVSAGNDHTVGLKSDGTVVAVGYNVLDLRDITSWTDIVAISAAFCTAGLRSDGTVVTSGDDFLNTANWTDIVDISVGIFHMVGLKSDGTVVAVGNNDYGQCDITSWTDIVDICVGYNHTVGLKSDGTVIAVGNNDLGQCYTSNWSNIVAVSACSDYTVGIKSDGTVVNNGSRHNTADWTDIVAISAGGLLTVGLKNDDTVVVESINGHRYNTSYWSDIIIYE